MAAPRVLDLDILIDREDWVAELPAVEGLCRQAADAAMAQTWHGTRCAEATLLLADDARIAHLNRTFRGIDGPTNVLSFPASDANIQQAGESDDTGRPVLLGDIILAFETVRVEANRDGKSLADHVSHLVVHGILHLLGYDHQTDPEADVMETLEASVLSGLGVADPYSDLHDI
ncbi:MAG: rRNA maturation RNase YbeY [Rhodospirillales bacterium]